MWRHYERLYEDAFETGMDVAQQLVFLFVGKKVGPCQLISYLAVGIYYYPVRYSALWPELLEHHLNGFLNLLQGSMHYRVKLLEGIPSGRADCIRH